MGNVVNVIVYNTTKNGGLVLSTTTDNTGMGEDFGDFLLDEEGNYITDEQGNKFKL